MLGYTTIALTLLAVGARQATAQYTSVYLPNFDPQAVSMTQVGAVDGTTTFLLVAGTPTASGEETFPSGVTLTYIAGPSAVAWHGSVEGHEGGDSCVIGADQVATCVISADGAPPFTTTEAYAATYPVQFAAPSGASSNTASTTAAGTSSTGPASKPAGQSSSGSLGSPAPSATKSSGAAAFTAAGLPAIGVPLVLTALAAIF